MVNEGKRLVPFRRAGTKKPAIPIQLAGTPHTTEAPAAIQQHAVNGLNQQHVLAHVPGPATPAGLAHVTAHWGQAAQAPDRASSGPVNYNTAAAAGMPVSSAWPPGATGQAQQAQQHMAGHPPLESIFARINQHLSQNAALREVPSNPSAVGVAAHLTAAINNLQQAGPPPSPCPAPLPVLPAQHAAAGGQPRTGHIWSAPELQAVVTPCPELLQLLLLPPAVVRLLAEAQRASKAVGATTTPRPPQMDLLSGIIVAQDSAAGPVVRSLRLASAPPLVAPGAPAPLHIGTTWLHVLAALPSAPTIALNKVLDLQLSAMSPPQLQSLLAEYAWTCLKAGGTAAFTKLQVLDTLHKVHSALHACYVVLKAVAEARYAAAGAHGAPLGSTLSLDAQSCWAAMMAHNNFELATKLATEVRAGVCREPIQQLQQLVLALPSSANPQQQWLAAAGLWVKAASLAPKKGISAPPMPAMPANGKPAPTDSSNTASHSHHSGKGTSLNQARSHSPAGKRRRSRSPAAKRRRSPSPVKRRGRSHSPSRKSPRSHSKRSHSPRRGTRSPCKDSKRRGRSRSRSRSRSKSKDRARGRDGSGRADERGRGHRSRSRGRRSRSRSRSRNGRGRSDSRQRRKQHQSSPDHQQQTDVQAMDEVIELEPDMDSDVMLVADMADSKPAAAPCPPLPPHLMLDLMPDYKTPYPYRPPLHTLLHPLQSQPVPPSQARNPAHSQPVPPPIPSHPPHPHMPQQAWRDVASTVGGTAGSAGLPVPPHLDLPPGFGTCAAPTPAAAMPSLQAPSIPVLGGSSAVPSTSNAAAAALPNDGVQPPPHASGAAQIPSQASVGTAEIKPGKPAGLLLTKEELRQYACLQCRKDQHVLPQLHFFTARLIQWLQDEYPRGLPVEDLDEDTHKRRLGPEGAFFNPTQLKDLQARSQLAVPPRLVADMGMPSPAHVVTALSTLFQIADGVVTLMPGYTRPIRTRIKAARSMAAAATAFPQGEEDEELASLQEAAAAAQQEAAQKEAAQKEAIQTEAAKQAAMLQAAQHTRAEPLQQEAAGQMQQQATSMAAPSVLDSLPKQGHREPPVIGTSLPQSETPLVPISGVHVHESLGVVPAGIAGMQAATAAAACAPAAVTGQVATVVQDPTVIAAVPPLELAVLQQALQQLQNRIEPAAPTDPALLAAPQQPTPAPAAASSAQQPAQSANPMPPLLSLDQFATLLEALQPESLPALQAAQQEVSAAQQAVSTATALQLPPLQGLAQGPPVGMAGAHPGVAETCFSSCVAALAQATAQPLVGNTTKPFDKRPLPHYTQDVLMYLAAKEGHMAPVSELDLEQPYPQHAAVTLTLWAREYADLFTFTEGRQCMLTDKGRARLSQLLRQKPQDMAGPGRSAVQPQAKSNSPHARVHPHAAPTQHNVQGWQPGPPPMRRTSRRSPQLGPPANAALELLFRPEPVADASDTQRQHQPGSTQTHSQQPNQEQPMQPPGAVTQEGQLESTLSAISNLLQLGLIQNSALVNSA